jgi:dipeptidyl aminopeptidase/acylaminoacyl peptidase
MEDMRSYGALDADLPDRVTYDRIQRQTECIRVTYRSGGFNVIALIEKPNRLMQPAYPAILMLHGGTGTFGMLPRSPLFTHLRLVSQGFILIAPQYRGTDGGEGHDEYGGDDIEDVMSLFPLAASLGYVDMRNVFMVGASRGGLMAYLALKRGAPVNAVAIRYGVTDAAAWLVARPDMEVLFRETIPGYEQNRNAELIRRSPVAWAEDLHAPLLIFHGTADERIPADDALRFARRLQALGKTYELVMYADDTHGLPHNAREVDRRILEWFRAHLVRGDERSRK